ncbi:hypothetical protein JHK85_043157 [Glycine max]|nr:hypothetical protein JHK86_042526 [Glycine max]KAG4956777.1 hypothetical protein JHK85_043157 [Glycine max]
MAVMTGLLIFQSCLGQVGFLSAKINDGRVVVSKGDVVALDDGDEGVGNEVVGVEAVVNEFDSSDTESNKGGSKSVSENDNEGVVLKIVKRREQLGMKKCGNKLA